MDATGAVLNPFGAETAQQSQNNLRMQMLASVMDYTAKFNGEFLGVGLYDAAAIKFGYGDMVQVFDHPPALDTSPGGGLAPMADGSVPEPGTLVLLAGGGLTVCIAGLLRRRQAEVAVWRATT